LATSGTAAYGPNRNGTMNLVVSNLCNKFQLAVTTGLLAVPGITPKTAYALPDGNFWGGATGCGVVEWAASTPQFPTPVRIFIKAFLNVTQPQFNALRVRSAYMQSNAFIKQAGVICGSNTTWVDTYANPVNKINIYSYINIPALISTSLGYCSPKLVLA
jgi:hypothetical protein